MTDARPTVRFRAPEDRALRGRLYRALAQDAAAADPPATILLEASYGGGPPELTVRPADLVYAVLAAPAFRDLHGRLTGPACRPEPPTGPIEASWTLVPAAGSPAFAPAALWDAPATEALLGSSARLDVQTFWLTGRSDGRLWVARRARFSVREEAALDARAGAVARFTAADWSRATGVLCRPGPTGAPGAAWAAAASRKLPRASWLAVPAALVERTAEPARTDEGFVPGSGDGHLIALGSSGAGKTTFLADRAARAIRQGLAVLAVDLHGDLGPAVVARLGPAERRRVVAVDAGRRPVVGVAALAGGSERTAAQFVAAVKRLSPDGNELYWGFRLERIFDAFVRLVQESGGSLGDLYALLTDPDRRDAARLATRSQELARFLEELGPIVRRSPEFLWSAAARLSKIVLVPELVELLAPADGGVPVEEVLESGRSLLVRLPFASLGPEAASLAGSLVLARCYLGLAGRRSTAGPHVPVVAVLDEVQGLSPRLVAEMLTEGRKFGFRLVLASQYPERLAPELRQAAGGVAGQVVAFRVPWASAREVGSWLGLSSAQAEDVLPGLPVGLGVGRAPGSGELRVVPGGREAPLDRGWAEVTGRTLEEFPAGPARELAVEDEATERLLLTILSAEERGEPLHGDRLLETARSMPGPALDPAVLGDRLRSLERSGLATSGLGPWHLTPAGERRLGLRADTGASRESAEHRALLLRAFRLFARRRLQLEIVRQGRYDTTLPDAVFRQIPRRRLGTTPRELAEAVGAAERTWAWRFFDGRDVHVEAEVSGALRPARVRHGLEKAQARGAFALFVVADAAKATRVRRTLRAEGIRPDRAQVWTLRGDVGGREGPAARDGKLPERSGES